ncbi:hypothetical protein Pcinc_003396 [Petrolisthes cinctipes]|uniref:Uncharacterized protein n=1 Tax=Petrolisthes cinctipes TaxID=88211 RepID=A0AAE1L240_PETCI|nr:hypothetical protein Pcinc_003396 [Petrolisthes cinctipes]
MKVGQQLTPSPVPEEDIERLSRSSRHPSSDPIPSPRRPSDLSPSAISCTSASPSRHPDIQTQDHSEDESTRMRSTRHMQPLIAQRRAVKWMTTATATCRRRRRRRRRWRRWTSQKTRCRERMASQDAVDSNPPPSNGWKLKCKNKILVADVKQPILGVNFLRKYDLLVDTKRQRLNQGPYNKYIQVVTQALLKSPTCARSHRKTTSRNFQH